MGETLRITAASMGATFGVMLVLTAAIKVLAQAEKRASCDRF